MTDLINISDLNDYLGGQDDANLKNNFSATTSPAITDDVGDGYSVGSHWYDTTNDKAYVCLDITLGAAVWTETTAGAAGGDSWGDVVDAVITPDADGTRDLATTATRFATAYTDNLDVTTNIVVGGTVDGRDLATDGTKLDAIEAAADVTDETNVTTALDGATLSAVTAANSFSVMP